MNAKKKISTCVPSLSRRTRTGSDTPTQSFSRPDVDDDDIDDDDDDDDDDDNDDYDDNDTPTQSFSQPDDDDADIDDDDVFLTFPKELIIGSHHKSLPDCSACTPHL